MNQELTIEQTVQKYIKPLVVKDFTQTNVADSKIEELKKYKELSGFSESADTSLDATIANKVLAKAMKALDLNIIIKRPPFIDMTINSNRQTTSNEMDRLYGRYDVNYLLELPEKKVNITTTNSFFGKHETINRQPQYLIEIPTKHFKGQVPDFAIEATGKATQFGLKPQVWVAGTYNELSGVVKEKIDPIVIGYPLISKDTYRWTHGLLLAAWGKDLEAMNQYFL